MFFNFFPASHFSSFLCPPPLSPLFSSSLILLLLSLSPAVRVSFRQASSNRRVSYSLSEDATRPLRVCLQLVVGSIEIPVSVTLSTQNGTALGEDGRGEGEGGREGGRGKEGGGEVRGRLSEGNWMREGRGVKWVWGTR